MKSRPQRKLAGRVLKCSSKKIYVDPLKVKEVKEAITKHDIRALVKKGSIKIRKKNAPSKVRARIKKVQKRKGRSAGMGKRKGKVTARESKKSKWMRKIRLQRIFLKELRVKKIITVSEYRLLYRKAKGGLFRSKAHLKLSIKK